MIEVKNKTYEGAVEHFPLKQKNQNPPLAQNKNIALCHGATQDLLEYCRYMQVSSTCQIPKGSVKTTSNPSQR